MTHEATEREPTIPTPLRETLSEIESRPLAPPMNAHERWKILDGQERSCRVAMDRELIEAVGNRYASACFDSFAAGNAAQLAARTACENYAASFRRHLEAGQGLLLYGPPGTGKDHLMVATARRLISREGISVRWINGLDLYRRMRDRIGDDGDESSIIRELSRPAVLAISDPLPPDGELTPFQKQTMFCIIDRRYRELRPTWATINVVDGSDFATRISEPIRDRLRDGAVSVHCNWPSYRGRR